MKRTEKDRLLYRKYNTKALHCHQGSYKDSKYDRNTKAGITRSMHPKSGEAYYDYTPLMRFLHSKIGKQWDEVRKSLRNRLPVFFKESDFPVYTKEQYNKRLEKNRSMFSRYEKTPEALELTVRKYAGTIYHGEHSLWHLLIIEDDGTLQLADKAITNEMFFPSCDCCTHTFNGKKFVKNFYDNPDYAQYKDSWENAKKAQKELKKNPEPELSILKERKQQDKTKHTL